MYDTSQFLSTNRDVIPDDLITVFGKENCQFGFASHLFATELRNLQNNYPRGACFRISPAAGSASANTAISQGNSLKGIDNWSVATKETAIEELRGSPSISDQRGAVTQFFD